MLHYFLNSFFCCKSLSGRLIKDVFYSFILILGPFNPAIALVILLFYPLTFKNKLVMNQKSANILIGVYSLANCSDNAETEKEFWLLWGTKVHPVN